MSDPGKTRKQLSEESTKLQPRSRQADDSIPGDRRSFGTVIESIFDIIEIVDSSGIIQYISPSCRQVLGYEQNELIGSNAFDLFHPDDLISARKSFEQLKESEHFTRFTDIRIRHKDGSWRIFESVNRNLLEDSSVGGIVIDYHDITERKQAEDALRESEEKYRRVYENSVIGMYRTTPDGQILMANPALLRMLGYSSFDDLRDRNLESSGYEPKYPRSMFLDEIESKGKVVGLESAWVRADGSTLYIRESARAVCDESGKALYYEGTVEDITERKRAEEQLQRLSSIAKQSTEGMALSDLEGHLQFVNNAFAEMHGYTPEELLGKHISVFHTPEQLSAVEVANRQILQIGEFRGEIWHTRRDGTVFPTLMNNTLLRDKSGKPIGMIGILRDITELKRSEEEIRQAYERLNATLNALPDLLFEIDRDGRFHGYHAPDTELLYAPPEQFLGQTVKDVLPEETAVIIMAAINEAVETGSHRGARYQLQTARGPAWFELSIAAKGDPNTPDGRLIGVAHNITERKRAEDMLRKMTDELKAEREALTEKNIALKLILEHIQDDRQESLLKVFQDIDKALAPLLKKLKTVAGKTHDKELGELESTFNAILAKDLDTFKGRYARLTARESEICNMIKNGMSSKQISQQLNLSLLTVQKHRELIRKKLEITHKAVSLATYLRSH